MEGEWHQIPSWAVLALFQDLSLCAFQREGNGDIQIMWFSIFNARDNSSCIHYCCFDIIQQTTVSLRPLKTTIEQIFCFNVSTYWSLLLKVKTITQCLLTSEYRDVLPFVRFLNCLNLFLLGNSFTASAIFDVAKKML